MARPSLIIGVGGTGTWVLSWLKKDLMEANGGDMRKLPVRFLQLDTADLITAVGRFNTTSNGQTPSGGVDSDQSRGSYFSRSTIIEPEEFVKLPGQISVDQSKELRDRVYQKDPALMESVGRWLCTDFPDQSWALGTGAGQFRQLGRLALVQGLLYNGTGDTVYAKLRSQIEAVFQQQEKMTGPGGQLALDVHVAGSFAGGTGSGLFLDIAWLIRKIVPKTCSLKIFGFFAMPGVFSQNPRREMRAKAYNAWRELNRMMTINREENSQFQLNWGSTADTITQIEQPVYDHVYLIDPKNGGISQQPQDVVFPIMAEAISFMVDDQSGNTYIQHITANLAKTKRSGVLRGRPTFSALYVKSWKLPTFHNVTVAQHKFALRYLKELLRLEEVDKTDDNGNQYKAYQLQPFNNCAERATEMLDGTLNEIGGSKFLSLQRHVADVPRNQIANEVQSYASAGSNLLAFYAEMPNTPDGQQVQLVIDEFAGFTVPEFIDTNSNEELRVQLTRTHEMLHGLNNMGGRYSEIYGDLKGQQVKGKLHDKLEDAHKLHLKLFRDRVRAWMIATLNQPGGLACVLSALSRLDVALDGNIQFFVQVERALPSVVDSDAAAQAAYALADIETQKTGLFQGITNRIGSGAKLAVQSYLNAERNYLWAQRDRRAIERYIGTLREMRVFLQDKALRMARVTESYLVTDDPAKGGIGLYRGVVNSLKDENFRHEFDQKLHEVTVLLEGDEALDAIDQGKLDALVNNTRWTVNNDFEVIAEVKYAETAPTMRLNIAGDPDQTRQLVRDLVLKVSADSIKTLAQPKTAYQTLRDNESYDAIRQQFEDCREPLFVQAAGRPAEDIRTFYVRSVVSESEKAEILNIIGKLGLPRDEPNTATVVGSENPNKVVIFSAREVMLPEAFAEWNQCQKAYEEMVIGKTRSGVHESYGLVRCDHLFAAEKNALELEVQAVRDGAEFQVLRPRLVHLLEQQDKLIELLQMWALGWLSSDGPATGMGERAWAILIPQTGGLSTRVVLADYTGKDMLTVMAAYSISGHDMRGRDLPYRQITAALEADLSARFRAEGGAAKLLADYKYQADAADKFSALIQNGLTMGWTPDTFDQQLQHTVDQTRAESDYRSTLAQELADDFTKSNEGANVLVTDAETHLQAIRMLVKPLYQRLINRTRDAARIR